MNEFLNQQDVRLENSRRLMDEAKRELARQVLGDSSSGSGIDYDTKMTVEAVQMPLKALRLKDLLKFMIVALNRWDLIFVIVAFLAVALLGMLTPYVTKLFMDEMIPSGKDDLLMPLGCLLVSATLGTTLFTVTRTLVILRVRDKMGIRLNSGLINRVFHLPAIFFRRWTSGELGMRIMHIGQIMTDVSEKGLSAMLSLVFAAVYFYQINTYAPKLLNMSIASFVIQVLLMMTFLWFSQKEESRINLMQGKLSGLLYGLLGGMRRIKSSGAEERAFAKWAMLFANSLKDRAGRNTFLVYYPAVTTLVTLGTTILTYYYTVKNLIPLSDYVAYTAAFGMVSTAITALANILPELAQMKPSLDQCRPILDEIPEVASEDAVKPPFLSGAIDINGLRFKYEDSSNYVINDLNLKIKAGEFVAIVGTSGCGKSTLIRLLLGFEKAEAGSVFFDSYNIDTVDLSALRQRIGTCLQDGRLFNGTIFDNITVSAPLSTQDEAWEAARLACLDEDIKNMGMGMHTLINDGGGGISGGQRQRVLIARALVGKPSILIFDEATSALDNITQRKVTENLNALHCTRIFIAHRLSTIRHCQRIIVLDKGHVAEEGTYEELMERQGLFYQLASRQIV